MTAPVEVRQNIRALITETEKDIRLTHQNLSKLFDFWNTYIQPREPMDMNCGFCRSEVVTRMRVLINSIAHEEQKAGEGI